MLRRWKKARLQAKGYRLDPYSLYRPPKMNSERSRLAFCYSTQAIASRASSAEAAGGPQLPAV